MISIFPQMNQEFNVESNSFRKGFSKVVFWNKQTFRIFMGFSFGVSAICRTLKHLYAAEKMSFSLCNWFACTHSSLASNVTLFYQRITSRCNHIDQYGVIDSSYSIIPGFLFLGLYRKPLFAGLKATQDDQSGGLKTGSAVYGQQAIRNIDDTRRIWNGVRWIPEEDS